MYKVLCIRVGRLERRDGFYHDEERSCENDAGMTFEERTGEGQIVGKANLPVDKQ